MCEAGTAVAAWCTRPQSRTSKVREGGGRGEELSLQLAVRWGAGGAKRCGEARRRARRRVGDSTSAMAKWDGRWIGLASSRLPSTQNQLTI